MPDTTGCVDCSNARPELYMVWPHVWEAAGMGHDDGWLCLGCLEGRLGRKLVLQDFTGAPANYFFVTVPRHLGYSGQEPEFNDYFMPLIEKEDARCP